MTLYPSKYANTEPGSTPLYIAWTWRRHHFENQTCQYKYKSLHNLDAVARIDAKTTGKVGRFVY